MDEIKHNLVIIAGLTPAIVTESVQFLTFGRVGHPLRFKDLRKPKVNIKISQISVLTTSLGKKRLVSELFKKGIFKKLCDEFKISWIKFSPHDIFVFKNRSGAEIEDIKTNEENICTADQIFNFIQEKTNDDSVLHCVIAGGRKNMDIYTAFAMQIYGRKDDKMYHVIVSEPFDRLDFTDPHGNPFYYIPKAPIEFSDREGKVKKFSSEAVIEMPEVPYIRFRYKIEKIWPDIFKAKRTYSEIVGIIQREIDLSSSPPLVSVDFAKFSMVVNDKINIPFKSSDLFIYAYLLMRRHSCKEAHDFGESCSNCRFDVELDETEHVILREDDALKFVLKMFYKVEKPDSRVGKTIDKWIKSGIPAQTLRDKVSNINKVLRSSLHDSFAYELVKISNLGKYRASYFIRLDPSRIRFLEFES